MTPSPPPPYSHLPNLLHPPPAQWPARGGPLKVIRPPPLPAHLLAGHKVPRDLLLREAVGAAPVRAAGALTEAVVTILVGEHFFQVRRLDGPEDGRGVDELLFLEQLAQLRAVGPVRGHEGFLFGFEAGAVVVGAVVVFAVGIDIGQRDVVVFEVW